MEQTTKRFPPNRVTDLVSLKQGGSRVSCRTSFEILPVDFVVTCLGKTGHYERCLACYPFEKENEERQQKIGIANERLKLLYEEFDKAAIRHSKDYYE
ncbi:MAG: hypothetical protein JRE14_00075 [Deltaproteobacteria bacterium]|nr:hypothetical protein [Deltaproteobacteria bacterium]MBW2632527.1 hypothetical protein [Deltaproteobacteria bacterium]